MRDDQLVALRPKLDLITDDSNEIEAFQNNTVRPILKLQHPVTRELLARAAHFQKICEKIDRSDDKAFAELLNKYVSSNITFKNQVIGCIIGVMTIEELKFYISEKVELNKRIIAMQQQRYVDSRD